MEVGGAGETRQSDGMSAPIERVPWIVWFRGP